MVPVGTASLRKRLADIYVSPVRFENLELVSEKTKMLYREQPLS